MGKRKTPRNDPSPVKTVLSEIAIMTPESGVKIAFLDLDRFQSVNLAQDVISQIL